MNKHNYIKKITIATLFMTVVQFALASISFTGITDEKNSLNKYSLKNLNRFHQSFSLITLKSTLHFKGSDLFTQPTNSGSEFKSMIRFDKGNTTYVMPYNFKLKVKVSKFKVPTPTY